MYKRQNSVKHFHSRHKKQKLNMKVIVTLLLCLICIGAVSALIVSKYGDFSKSKINSVKKSSQMNMVSQPSSSSSQASSASTSAQAVQIDLQDALKPLWIHVSIATQIVTIYDANNKVVESFICSTGSPGYNTPTGIFTIQNRGKSFYSKKYQEGGYYWVAFYEDYYFHSVPFDSNSQIISSIANDLGHEDSHGCVHLSITDSEWIYDNIPKGTKVVIE